MSSEISKKTVSRRLDEIVEADASILYGILQPGPNIPDGVPYVRPTEIQGDIIDLSSIRRTTHQIAAKYKRSRLRCWDIILSIVGTIGKVAIVPAELEGGNITQSSVRIRVRPEVALPTYIAWALRSPVLRRQYDATRLGTAVPRLNVAHVRALRVPVPPLEEQQQIVAELDEQFTRLDVAMTAVRQIEIKAQRLRSAILSRAFRL